MKYHDWNEQKNETLKVERGVGFEDVVTAIAEGNLLDILRHKNQTRYKGQHIFVIRLGDYVYCCPFVEDDEKYFLKTIYPSRVLTKKYLSKRGKQ